MISEEHIITTPVKLIPGRKQPRQSRDTVIAPKGLLLPPPHTPTSEYTPSFTSQVLRNSNSKLGLPSYTEIHTVSPSAAGFPVLEVVRRLESENILTKDDRLALKDGLYSTDVSRREEVVKALCEVELAMNSRFAIRKLKSVIHQNGSGLAQPVSMSSNSEKTGRVSSMSQLISLQNNPVSESSVPGSSMPDSYVRQSFPQHGMVGSSSNGSLSKLNHNHNGDNTIHTNQHVPPTTTSDNTTSPNMKLEMKLNFNQTSGKSAGGSSKQYSSPDLQSQPHSNRLALNSGRRTGSEKITSASQVQNSPNQHHSPILLHPQIQNDYDAGYEYVNTQSAIHQVVGDYPLYSGPSNYNVLDKISARLHEYNTGKLPLPGGNFRPRKYAVVVGCGSFNPLTRMHLRTFYLAKQYIESKLGYVMLGTLLSPAHAVTVRERYRTNTSEIIPAPHRLAVAQLLIQNSKWLSIDPWEITRRRTMDYLSLLEHVQGMLGEHFPETEIKVIYFSKGNMIPKLSPIALRNQNFGCICVCRAPESDVLRASLTSKWNGIISVAEDTAILDASLDVVTSRKVRDKIRAGESVAHLVGEKIHDYVLVHHIGAKMNGLEDWSADEKLLPKFASRPAEPHLRSQSVQSSSVSVSSGSSMSMRSHTTGTRYGALRDSSGAYSYTPSWSSGGPSSGFGTGLSSAGINTGSLMHNSVSNSTLHGGGPSLNNILEQPTDWESDDDNSHNGDVIDTTADTTNTTTTANV